MCSLAVTLQAKYRCAYCQGADVTVWLLSASMDADTFVNGKTCQCVSTTQTRFDPVGLTFV